MPEDALRTPEHRFDALPDFPWTPKYADDLPGAEGLRIAWLDEGPTDAHAFLCLHGQPSWSFLYRKMIPVFLRAGGRVIAPDLLGFGRSDKPTDEAAYSFDRHRRILISLVDRLGLSGITLVLQDWGGLLGLTLPLDRPALVSRLIAMNTTLADGSPAGEGFDQWRAYARSQPDLAVGRLIRRSAPELTDAELAAYDAPFPDARYKAGVRAFPELVPVRPEMPGADLGRRAARWWTERWSGPSFLAVGTRDPVLGPPTMQRLRGLIASAPEPMAFDAGHFVQEEAGDRIASAALAAFG